MHSLFGAAPNIEQVDRPVKSIAARHGMHSEAVGEVVAVVKAWLDTNRRVA